MASSNIVNEDRNQAVNTVKSELLYWQDKLEDEPELFYCYV